MTTTALHDELRGLEEAAWRALSTSGEAAAEYYEHRLAHEVVVLLPDGMVICDRRRVIDSMRGEPWSEFSLSHLRVLPIGDDGAVLTYRADARRGDQEFEALLTSIYRREEGEWKLAAHQQTPL